MKTIIEILDDLAERANYVSFRSAMMATIDESTKIIEEAAEIYANQSKWVDSKVQQPENFKAVLIEADFIGKSHMAEIATVGCWQLDHWTTDRDQDLDKIEINVNRWMPLPI